MAEKKTKSVDDQDLTAEDFAYVGDPERTATWHLPIHDADHVRNALARFNQAEIPEGERKAVARKLVAAAKKYGIETEGFEEKYLSEATPLCGDSGFSIQLDELPAPLTAGGRKFLMPVAISGEWHMGARKLSISRADLAAMARNFLKRKNGEIVLDYEHASEMPENARGGPVPAAGWIRKLEANGALTAEVEFTPRALEMIRAGEYRYFSPAIDFHAHDKQTGEPQGATLTSGALTNRPFLEELPAIKLSEIGRSGDRAIPLGAGSPNSQIAKSPDERQGGTVDKLTATKATGDEYMIARGTEVLGMVEIPAAPGPSPEEQFATFAEKVGAKGQTEEQLKTILRSAQDDSSARAAQQLLLTECVKDGKLDREKMKLLAREQRVSLEHFLAFEEAFSQVDDAVEAGKVLPKHRNFFLGVALREGKAAEMFLADAPKVISLKPAGLAGERTRASEPGAGVKVSPGKTVVNADRVARIQFLREESAKAGKLLTYLQARKQVLAEERAAGIDGDGQAA